MLKNRTNEQGAYSTLVELLQSRASLQPDSKLYTFLLDGDQEEASLTYRQLDVRARAFAVRLQDLGATGERALLLYQPGLDYIVAFYGCLYAGVTVVPAYPPHPKKPMPRLQAVVADSQARFAITSSKLYRDIEVRFSEYQELARLKWVVSDDELGEEGSDRWTNSAIGSDTLAFLQYTSGSTSLPKGVMLTHGNLFHNLKNIEYAFEMSSESRGVIWLPPFHDMGLIGGILSPLYAGYHMTLMAPFDFLQRPIRWLQAISRTRATISGGPNFAYDLCVRKVTPEQRAQLDLSEWKLAFNGAEPIQAGTLQRFADYFEPAGFRMEQHYPCYGLAESSLIVTGAQVGQVPAIRTFDSGALMENRVVQRFDDSANERAIVGSGRVLLDEDLIIVNPDTEVPCAEDEVGELWVSSPSVAAGYWGNPAQTEATFRATLEGREGRTYLRTGDLGFLHEGELFVTGRIKDLIVIRGRNHYPQDIEQTIETNLDVIRDGCSAAFSVEIDGEERLVIAAELDRSFRPHKSPDGATAADVDARLKEVAMSIRKLVIEHHELLIHDVRLLKMGGIPKTSSGKIQRHACRAGFLNNTLQAWGE